MLIWPATGAVEDAQDMDGVADDAVRQHVRCAGYDELACFPPPFPCPRAGKGREGASGFRQPAELALGTVDDACDQCVGGTLTILRDIRVERAKVRQCRPGPENPHLARARDGLRLAPSDPAHARTSSCGTRSPRSAAAMPSLMAAICHSCTARNASIA